MANKDKCCTNCYDPKLDALIYHSKATLVGLSDQIIKKRSYGFSCDKKANSKADLLQRYLDVLESENRKIALGGEPCLGCYDMQTLAEKVRVLTFTCNMEDRMDLTKDDSEVDTWTVQNPFCVSRERWEKIAKMVCEAFNLEVTIDGVHDMDTMCNLTFEIVRKLVNCDVLLAISVHHEMCDLDFKITRTEEECKLDFNILVSELDCDIDFRLYKQLIECNLSFDVIKTVYENGCTFNIGDPVTLVTPMGNEIPLDDLKIKGTPNVDTLKRLGVDLSNSKFIKNPNQFINKLKEDYGGK